MKILFRLIFLSVLISFFSCDNGAELPAPSGTSDTVDPDSPEWVSTNQQFSLNMMKELFSVKGQENIFFSPLSIEMALSMTANGAEGNTQTEMRQALGQQNFTTEAVNKQFQTLMDNLPERDNFKINLANSIWYKNTFEVKPDFLQTNQSFYEAEVSALDLTAPDAPNQINQWVSNATEGKIPKVLDQIKQDDIMFLINAIYFEAAWKDSFPVFDTKDQLFSVNGDSPQLRKFMKLKKTYPYLETDDFQAVSLPYAVDDYAMTIFLPSEGSSLGNLVNSLSASQMDEYLSQLSEAEVYLRLPRFSMEFEQSLKTMLANMGMKAAFQPQQADLTSISETGDLYVSEVKHNSFLQVYEQGTIAAAATTVAVGTTSIEIPNGDYIMDVDRPFLLMIHQQSTSRILFMGSIQNPEPIND
ncbi:MAG: serpin family protein [Bacteroidota bacterium]